MMNWIYTIDEAAHINSEILTQKKENKQMNRPWTDQLRELMNKKSSRWRGEEAWKDLMGEAVWDEDDPLK
jgi:hypothetical protein